jgi:hypothetical protein
VLRTFGRLASPPVTDVEIDWGNADAQVAPRALPPLFDGDALRAFARVPGRLPESVTLRCNTANGPKSWSVRVREGADPADVLPTLWARAMIRTLEEEDDVRQTVSISAPSAERSKLIEISKRYNLLCSLTSFVAVEHRSLEDRNEGRPAVRRVPVQMIAGGDGSDTVLGADLCLSAGSGSGLLDLTRESDDTHLGAELLDEISPASGSVAGAPRGINRFTASSDQSMDRSIDKSIDYNRLGDAAPRRPLKERLRAVFGAKKSLAAAPPPPPAPSANRTFAPAPAQPDDDLVQLLARQAADGSFDESTTVMQILYRAPVDWPRLNAALSKLLHDAHVSEAVRRPVAQTLRILLHLRTVCADRQPVWQRAAKKAIRYVTDAAQLHAGQVETWLAELEAVAGKASVK